jgi:hypothetical protein
MFIQRSKVLFPEPLGPKITFTSFSDKSSETPLRTCRLSYAFHTSTIDNNGSVIFNHHPFPIFLVF